MFFYVSPKNVDILSNFGRMRFKLEDKMRSPEEYDKENWNIIREQNRKSYPNCQGYYPHLSDDWQNKSTGTEFAPLAKPKKKLKKLPKKVDCIIHQFENAVVEYAETENISDEYGICDREVSKGLSEAEEKYNKTRQRLEKYILNLINRTRQ